MSKAATLPQDLYLLSKLLAEMEPDQMIWKEITSGKMSWDKVLAILGWDPAAASCECGRKPLAFNIARQDFACQACASGLKADELIYI